MRGGSDLRKAYRAIGALSVTVVLIAGITILMRATYGYFNNDLKVTGTFPRASQALKKGSDVKYLGVSVGKVKSISLQDDHRVKITLDLSKSSKIPSDVMAIIEPNTFFGDKFVDLKPQGSQHGPWLKNGSTLQRTSSGEEVEQLIGDADTLFAGINTKDLTTLMTELTEFSQGEGERIAQNFDVGVKAASSFSDTLDAQLNALDALARFQASIKNIGPAVNGISADLNVALPTFNAARADFYRMLDTLRPFADNLASLISVNRPSLDRILNNGDNIARMTLVERQHIGETVYGLSRYLYKFGAGGSADTLPDGSKFAYFKQIVDFTDITKLLCGVLGPSQAAPPPAGLGPQFGVFQTALIGLVNTASGGKINCTAANNPSSMQTAAQSAPSSAPGQNITDQVYGSMATPDTSQPTSLQSLVTGLLRGLS